MDYSLGYQVILLNHTATPNRVEQETKREIPAINFKEFSLLQDNPAFITAFPGLFLVLPCSTLQCTPICPEFLDATLTLKNCKIEDLGTWTKMLN